MPDEENNLGRGSLGEGGCPSCAEHPFGEPLPGGFSVFPYTPPTADELEFSRRFYANMKARTGHDPGEGIPAQEQAPEHEPTLTAEMLQRLNAGEAVLMPDISGLHKDPQGPAATPIHTASPEATPESAFSEAIHQAMSGQDAPMPSQLTAPWLQASSLVGTQLQSVGGTGIVKDYRYAGANGCIYRIRIKKPAAVPDISQEDLDYIASTLAVIASVESGDPPSADTLWKYFDRPIGIRRDDTVIAVLKLDGMIFLPEPCIIWIQFSLAWWRGEGTGEAGVVSGRGVAPGDPAKGAPGPPAGATSAEDCEEWARRYIAWLKAQGKDPGYSVTAYCAGRRYAFVVHQDGEVHAIHYPPIPGVSDGKLPMGPGGTGQPTGPTEVTCPGSPPTIVSSQNKWSPPRKRGAPPPFPDAPPVWDETWQEYVARVQQSRWWNDVTKFGESCGLDANGNPIPGTAVLFEAFDWMGRPIPMADAEKHASNMRAVCYKCAGTCWPGTNCQPDYGAQGVECNCV